MTWEEALDHSLPRLQLMLDAFGRLQAADALTLTQGVHAATAACSSKEGGRYLKRTMAELKRQMMPT